MRTSLLVVCVLPAQLAAQCTPGWLPGRARLDIGGSVYGMTLWDPDSAGPAPEMLIIAGGFLNAGGQITPGIAGFDGVDYHQFGDKALPALIPLSPCVHEGELYIGAQDHIPGGPRTVLRWTGQDWGIVGGGLRGFAVELTVHEGELIAIGNLAAPGTSLSVPGYPAWAWDGTNWRKLGAALNGFAYTVESTPLGLVVGGDIGGGGGTITGVARWGGQEWQPLGGGLIVSQYGPAFVGALAWQHDQLYAGGYFKTDASNPDSFFLARWDQNAWTGIPGLTAMPSPSSPGVHVLKSFGEQLVIGGEFFAPGGSPNMAVWDGVSMKAMGPGLGTEDLGTIYALGLWQNSVIAGGRFRQAGAYRLSNIASFDGAAWNILREGNDGVVYAFTRHEGALYAAGDIGRFEGIDTHGIAKRVGSGWVAIPAFPGPSTTYIRQLGSHDGRLAAAAYIPTTTKTLGLGLWDGAAWEVVSDDLEPLDFYWIQSHGGELIVGGWFSGVSGPVARWDGTNWSAMKGGSGLEGYTFCAHIHEGELFVGGNITLADGEPTPNIARWDGAQWRAVGDPLSPLPTLWAMTSFEGKLTVAGDNTVAQWNGQGWTTLDAPGMNVRFLAATDRGLFAAGTPIGGGAQLLLWDNAAWHTISTGPGDAVTALAAGEPDATLYVGNQYGFMGGQHATSIARLSCPACYANCDGSTGSPVLSIADFACFLDRFTAGDPYANCDGSTAAPTLNIADFGCFLGKFAAGCP